jgi:hypothetical protein
MKKWLFVFAVIILGAFVCKAGGIEGKWKTSIEGPDGKMEITFTFKVDGNVLTGSVGSPMGDLPITNGKINGNEFSFDVDMGGNPMPHKGTLDGDTIKMKIVGGPGGPDGGSPDGGAGPGGFGEMLLKRVVE